MFVLSGSIWLVANSYVKSERIEEISIRFQNTRAVSLIGEDYIRDLIQADLKLEGSRLGSIDLYRIERILKNNSYIENAEVFFHNNVLVIQVWTREPIARVYYKEKVFYWDKQGNILPPSHLVSPNVPVILPDVAMESDSGLQNIWKYLAPLLHHISRDEFWNAYISCVKIHKDSTITLYPTVGDAEFFVGKIGRNIARKIELVDIFNKKIFNKRGWGEYKKVRVDIKNQIIGIKSE